MPEAMDLTETIGAFRLGGLMEAFHAATGVPVGIMDRDGEFPVALGWADICTRFHRATPASAALCSESDRVIADRLRGGGAGTGYVRHRCPLGLVDVAFPIVVAGQHVGTFFIGQFLESAPDRRRFEQQAKRFGYDLPAYLQALETVRVVDDEHVPRLMAFLMQVVDVVAAMASERDARVRIEQELLRVNSDLERQVEQRTRELHEALDRLAREASHDHLTGLVNRRYLADALDREIARSRRSGVPLSLVMIDMDGLKDTNDRFGHSTGDRALVAVAAAMSERLRRGDILGRWGGDEFCAMLADTPLEGAIAVAERLRAGVAADVRATVSIGVAEWAGEPAETLLHRADDALYRAKRDGRNACRAHLRASPADVPRPRTPEAEGSQPGMLERGSMPDR